MKVSRSIIYVLLVGILSGCSQSLSRDEAAKLIQTAPAFKNLDQSGTTGLLGTVSKLSKVQELLIKEGYLSLATNSSNQKTINVTSKGKQAFPHINYRPGIFGFGQYISYDVPVAKPEFIAVTGLKEEKEQNLVRAEYSYKFVLNEMGQKIALVDPNNLITKNLNSLGNRKGSAKFSKYDDGWRLTGFDY